ncbi:MAG: cytochrome d ubiquinol oxidase subunit II [Kiloniellales bacterium]
MTIDLPMVWAFIIAFAVFAYVFLDGFDLGIGILSAFVGRREDRDLMMNSVAPVWDGNQTWLVLGGGGLMAVFPLAYAVLLPALYAPLIAMLLGLIFRGVAFEFRHRSRRWRGFWDLGFWSGSLAATFFQGIALGAFIQGIAVDGRAYAGGWFDWLSPFSLLTAVALAIGYALLGACWLIYKTEGELQVRFYGYAGRLGRTVVLLIVIVSLATPFLAPEIAERWFSWPNILFVSPVPLLVAAIAFLFYRALEERRELAPFLLAQGFFLLSYIGLGISLFPYIVPRSITVWQAAAPESTLIFTLIGAAILIPIILAYSGYSYWVFRGKVRHGEGYH